jgi:Cu/Ag efflux protein CusF
LRHQDSLCCKRRPPFTIAESGIAVVTTFKEVRMTVRFSIALQLLLAVASVPAMALADQITQLAPFDAGEQKLEGGWKEEGIVVASASEATKAAGPTGLIPGRGVVVKVDHANATVTINHDPIPVLNWPRMTMPFRLKENALAEEVKEGDVVQFSLEKSGSDYIIVKWRK